MSPFQPHVLTPVQHEVLALAQRHGKGLTRFLPRSRGERAAALVERIDRFGVRHGSGSGLSADRPDPDGVERSSMLRAPIG